MEDNRKQNFTNKIEKDKLAKNGWLYQKHIDSIKQFLRFNKYDYDDMKISLEKAHIIYQKKLAQLNAMTFLMDLFYASNTYYYLTAREMFGWQIQLIDKECRDYLEYLINQITKE